MRDINGNVGHRPSSSNRLSGSVSMEGGGAIGGGYPGGRRRITNRLVQWISLRLREIRQLLSSSLRFPSLRRSQAAGQESKRTDRSDPVHPLSLNRQKQIAAEDISYKGKKILGERIILAEGERAAVERPFIEMSKKWSPLVEVGGRNIPNPIIADFYRNRYCVVKKDESGSISKMTINTLGPEGASEAARSEGIERLTDGLGTDSLLLKIICNIVHQGGFLGVVGILNDYPTILMVDGKSVALPQAQREGETEFVIKLEKPGVARVTFLHTSKAPAVGIFELDEGIKRMIMKSGSPIDPIKWSAEFDILVDTRVNDTKDGESDEGRLFNCRLDGDVIVSFSRAEDSPR